MAKKTYNKIMEILENTNFCFEHLVFDNDKEIFINNLKYMLYNGDLSETEHINLINKIKLICYEDDNKYICEVCGNSVYIEGDIGYFICPECGAEQNV